jgi:pilus assembly protein CpaB
MNNTVLKIIAGLLALGAVVVAIVGVRLSQQAPAAPKPVAQAASVPTEAVVVAARAIKAGQALGPADIVIKGVANPPAQAFKEAQELPGRVAAMDITAGTPLEPRQFATDTLASHLRPGERAVAVFVDEVVGIGGFGKPGDHVDVLSFVGAKKETNENSYAQIVVQDARVMSFGDTTQMDAERERDTAPLTQEAMAESGAKNLKEMKDRKLSLHSAVLAVAEADVTRLMLAANAGVLRLALRPQIAVQPDPLGMYPASLKGASASVPRQTIALHELAPAERKPPVPPQPVMDNIIIQEGSKERRLTKNDTPSPSQP